MAGDWPTATARATTSAFLCSRRICSTVCSIVGRSPVEGGPVAEFDQVEVDLTLVELDGDEMGLLGDPHRRPRVAGAQLDDLLQRRRGDRQSSAAKRSASPRSQSSVAIGRSE